VHRGAVAELQGTAGFRRGPGLCGIELLLAFTRWDLRVATVCDCVARTRPPPPGDEMTTLEMKLIPSPANGVNGLGLGQLLGPRGADCSSIQFQSMAPATSEALAVLHSNIPIGFCQPLHVHEIACTESEVARRGAAILLAC
jgi:hypothetical protein